jgi:EAL domain-containing protein (putative c-di-GMP-specific phosphodiesterase class I)/GGDEF domain-containing protein
MDIRHTAFWRDIEGIFQEQSWSGRGWEADNANHSRLCSYAQFMDRLGNSLRRARRNNEYVLLILLQFAQAQHGRCSGGVDAVDPGELLVCRLSSCIRASDSLCELGQGRFAMLLEDVREPSAAPMVIEKLNATLLGHPRAERRPGQAQPHLGVSLFPAADLPPGQIWLHAEAALEQAMAMGPGCYSISPAVTGQTAMERFELSTDLYKGYRNDEFEVVYQPIVGFSGKRVQALEALLRWQHPQRGCLSPRVFLPLLEESGLIVPVGERLLNQACRMASRLRDEGGASFRVCVNISARQLVDRGFLLTVLDALYDTGLAPQALQLEFSETVLTNESQLLGRLLPELKSTGVRLAVDQFGTSKAPLAELLSLPLNLIKLDRSLVKGLLDDAVSQAIISGTVALAGSAGMAVAAVGVEQQLQGEVLEKLGCCEGQGRHYAYPVPAAEVGTTMNP